MRRLVCAFVVRKPPKTGFLAARPSHLDLDQLASSKTILARLILYNVFRKKYIHIVRLAGKTVSVYYSDRETPTTWEWDSRICIGTRENWRRMDNSRQRPDWTGNGYIYKTSSQLHCWRMEFDSRSWFQWICQVEISS